jgi:hypothetical protein
MNSVFFGGRREFFINIKRGGKESSETIAPAALENFAWMFETMATRSA